MSISLDNNSNLANLYSNELRNNTLREHGAIGNEIYKFFLCPEFKAQSKGKIRAFHFTSVIFKIYLNNFNAVFNSNSSCKIDKILNLCLDEFLIVSRDLLCNGDKQYVERSLIKAKWREMVYNLKWDNEYGFFEESIKVIKRWMSFYAKMFDKSRRFFVGGSDSYLSSIKKTTSDLCAKDFFGICNKSVGQMSMTGGTILLTGSSSPAEGEIDYDLRFESFGVTRYIFNSGYFCFIVSGDEKGRMLVKFMFNLVDIVMPIFSPKNNYAFLYNMGRFRNSLFRSTDEIRGDILHQEPMDVILSRMDNSLVSVYTLAEGEVINILGDVKTISKFHQDNIGDMKHKDKSSEGQKRYTLEESLKELDLLYLLGEKFDKNTAVVLTEYTKDFWSLEDIDIFLYYIIKYNTGCMVNKILPFSNWQKKRYINDISYIRLAAGYPILNYFEPKIPPTKTVKKYLGLLEMKKRRMTRSVPFESLAEEKIRIKSKQNANNNIVNGASIVCGRDIFKNPRKLRVNLNWSVDKHYCINKKVSAHLNGEKVFKPDKELIEHVDKIVKENKREEEMCAKIINKGSILEPFKNDYKEALLRNKENLNKNKCLLDEIKQKFVLQDRLKCNENTKSVLMEQEIESLMSDKTLVELKKFPSFFSNEREEKEKEKEKYHKKRAFYKEGLKPVYLSLSLNNCYSILDKIEDDFEAFTLRLENELKRREEELNNFYEENKGVEIGEKEVNKAKKLVLTKYIKSKSELKTEKFKRDFSKKKGKFNSLGQKVKSKINSIVTGFQKSNNKINKKGFTKSELREKGEVNFNQENKDRRGKILLALKDLDPMESESGNFNLGSINKSRARYIKEKWGTREKQNEKKFVFLNTPLFDFSVKTVNENKEIEIKSLSYIELANKRTMERRQENEKEEKRKEEERIKSTELLDNILERQKNRKKKRMMSNTPSDSSEVITLTEKEKKRADIKLKKKMEKMKRKEEELRERERRKREKKGESSTDSDESEVEYFDEYGNINVYY